MALFIPGPDFPNSVLNKLKRLGFSKADQDFAKGKIPKLSWEEAYQLLNVHLYQDHWKDELVEQLLTKARNRPQFKKTFDLLFSDESKHDILIENYVHFLESRKEFFDISFEISFISGYGKAIMYSKKLLRAYISLCSSMKMNSTSSPSWSLLLKAKLFRVN
jgi:hypothetical protein